VGMKMKLCSVILSGILAALAFRYCPIPWSAAFLLTAVLLAIFARLAKRTGAAVLMVNIAAVLLALVIFEGYIGIEQLRGDGTRMEGTITDGFVHADDMLGYAPDRNTRVTARKYYSDTLLYDVVYSIDGQGLRIAPTADQRGLSECVVFFGDSVTFGEGVNDDQTFPYRVGVKTNGRYAVYNFAFSGYGAHQMLANLQSGLVDQRINCKPTHFFYLVIPDQLRRVAGLASWDPHGPRFTLAANGEAVRAGNFDDPASIFGQVREPHWVELAFDKFFAWQRFFGRARDPNPADLQLLVAVVRTSARLAKQHYPNSQFHVLLYDMVVELDEPLTVMEKELHSAGIPVHRISKAVPDLRVHSTHYILSIHDPHPNPLLHDRIADYLVHDILAD
jgi:hypothetical protein